MHRQRQWLRLRLPMTEPMLVARLSSPNMRPLELAGTNSAMKATESGLMAANPTLSSAQASASVVNELASPTNHEVAAHDSTAPVRSLDLGTTSEA